MRHPRIGAFFVMTKTTTMKRAAITLLLILAAANCPAKRAIPDASAIRAIVGEAGNQSDLAMLAVAGSLRQRGTLQGVYGVSAPVAAHPSAALWARAARAWARSARPLTGSSVTLALAAGCRYFGCPADAPYFLHTLHYHPVVTIGQITFYAPAHKP